MTIELSPSQERKLHSILDRGLNTLNNFSEKLSPSPFLQRLTNLKSLSNESPSNVSKSPVDTEKSKILNSELKSLQAKLATLEARLETKPQNIRKKSGQGQIKYTAETTPRSSSSLSRKGIKREKQQNLEDVEREIEKLERSITPSPARFRANMKKTEKSRPSSVNRQSSESKMKKENENLKAEIKKMSEVLQEHNKLKEEFQSLLVAFDKSERIRKKQKDVILKLKGELKSFI